MGLILSKQRVRIRNQNESVPPCPLVPGMVWYWMNKFSEWIRQCVEVADSVPQDDIAKADYLADLAILGGLIFDYSTIKETIMETIMQESSVIQHFLQKGIEQGIEQGIERGTRESLIEGILENLEVRFNANNLQAVASTLEYVDDVQRLRQLRREALQTPSLEAFWHTLGLIVTTNGNDSR